MQNSTASGGPTTPRKPRPETDVVILGAGLAGTTLAACLARQGARVLILDAASHPRFAIGESTIPYTSMLMRLVAERYDVVLYDAAAFAHGADALAIAGRVGGVLLVARRNKTHIDDVSYVAEQVNQLGAQVVGSVLVDF